jgi:hypothetical protein
MVGKAALAFSWDGLKLPSIALVYIALVKVLS